MQSSSRSCCHEIVVPRDLRSGGYTPKTDTTCPPPSGKIDFHLEDVKYVKQINSCNTVAIILNNGEDRTLSVKEWYCITSKYGPKPYTSDRKPKDGQVTWCGKLIITKEEYEQENPPSGKNGGRVTTWEPPSGKNLDGLRDTLVENGLKDRMETKYVHTLVFGKEQIAPQIWGRRDTVKSFAGDDSAHVEKLLVGVPLDSARLVHVKCAELGTETLVALSPEGETLARIVKDNSKKYSKI